MQGNIPERLTEVPEGEVSRQVSRTRSAIKSAFAELVFAKAYEEIRMSEVAARANVGRSTLYLHYRDKDAILIDNLTPILGRLAEVLTDNEGSQIEDTLRHIWAHRDRGRVLFFGVTGQKLERALVREILARESGVAGLSKSTLPAGFVANQIAAAIFSVLRTWVKGEASASVSAIAVHLCRSSKALVYSAGR